MPASKIVDEGEVIRWYESGMTYAEMVEQYATKYNLEVSPSMFSNFRARRGLTRRAARDDDLIPWHVERKHRWRYPLAMLRYEARRRAGMDIEPDRLEALEAWLAHLREEELVVHYDPETEDGFFYVDPRPGVDTDLIRVPDRKTTERRSADS